MHQLMLKSTVRLEKAVLISQISLKTLKQWCIFCEIYAILGEKRGGLLFIVCFYVVLGLVCWSFWQKFAILHLFCESRRLSLTAACRRFDYTDAYDQLLLLFTPWFLLLESQTPSMMHDLLRPLTKKNQIYAQSLSKATTLT